MRDTGIYADDDNRSATAAGVSYSGVGYMPSMILFLAADHTPANMNWSIGIDTLFKHYCIYFGDTGTTINFSSAFSVYIKRAGANYIYGKVVGLDADGFTYDWTVNGAANVDVAYFCFP